MTLGLPSGLNDPKKPWFQPFHSASSPRNSSIRFKRVIPQCAVSRTESPLTVWLLYNKRGGPEPDDNKGDGQKVYSVEVVPVR